MRLAPALRKRFGDLQPEQGVAVIFSLVGNLPIAVGSKYYERIFREVG